MDLNHRRAFSLLLYQLSYNHIRYSAYKANCTLSSEPRIIDKRVIMLPLSGWCYRPDSNGHAVSCKGF